MLYWSFENVEGGIWETKKLWKKNTYNYWPAYDPFFKMSQCNLDGEELKAKLNQNYSVPHQIPFSSIQ